MKKIKAIIIILDSAPNAPECVEVSSIVITGTNEIEFEITETQEVVEIRFEEVP